MKCKILTKLTYTLYFCIVRRLVPRCGSSRDIVFGQMSSISSMGTSKIPGTNQRDCAWLKTNLLRSLRGGVESSLKSFKLIFPSVEDVRNGYFGYASGGYIPHSADHASSQMALQSIAHRWKASWCNRTDALPHMKSYGRWDPESKALRWFLLTSCNLSQAAWGTEQNSGKSLFIRSFELGVLLLPNNDTTLLPSQFTNTSAIDKTIHIPVPYELPLTPYSPGKPIIDVNDFSKFMMVCN
eukprot:m.238008 g.238008  ORF g.238008 m.238008 type:complete len:240 (+) comp16058_c0_seq16:1193-1912(+)